MTAREIVSVLGKLAPNTQQALSDRAIQRDPRFLFICDLVDEVQQRLCLNPNSVMTRSEQQQRLSLARS